VVNRWQIVLQTIGPAVFQMLTCKNLKLVFVFHKIFGNYYKLLGFEEVTK
jgi:hypothetical protein